VQVLFVFFECVESDIGRIVQVLFVSPAMAAVWSSFVVSLCASILSSSMDRIDSVVGRESLALGEGSGQKVQHRSLTCETS
jgi:phosphate/sulfate permease